MNNSDVWAASHRKAVRRKAAHYVGTGERSQDPERIVTKQPVDVAIAERRAVLAEYLCHQCERVTCLSTVPANESPDLKRAHFHIMSPHGSVNMYGRQ